MEKHVALFILSIYSMASLRLQSSDSNNFYPFIENYLRVRPIEQEASAV